MHKTFTRLRALLTSRALPQTHDPLRHMSPRELADLPPHHPGRDTLH